jgi:probable rRNA maturation factor
VTIPAEPLSAVPLDLAFALDASLPPSMLQPFGAAASASEGEAFWSRRLGCWLAQLRSELPEVLRAASYSLGLRLTDDGGITPLNEQWRHHSGPTDVLAFAAQEQAPPAGEGTDREALGEHRGLREPVPLELGDIIISIETAARQAQTMGQAPGWEILFLASHGLLHLLGWDHPDEQTLAAMLERQERLIALDGEGLP